MRQRNHIRRPYAETDRRQRVSKSEVLAGHDSVECRERVAGVADANSREGRSEVDRYSARAKVWKERLVGEYIASWGKK